MSNSKSDEFYSKQSLDGVPEELFHQPTRIDDDKGDRPAGSRVGATAGTLATVWKTDEEVDFIKLEWVPMILGKLRMDAAS